MTLWYKNFKNKSENNDISCDKPPGVPSVSKIQKTKIKTTLVGWSAKIQPKLNEIWINLHKTGGFFWQLNFDGFLQFVQFWLNISGLI